MSRTDRDYIGTGAVLPAKPGRRDVAVKSDSGGPIVFLRGFEGKLLPGTKVRYQTLNKIIKTDGNGRRIGGYIMADFLEELKTPESGGIEENLRDAMEMFHGVEAVYEERLKTHLCQSRRNHVCRSLKTILISIREETYPLALRTVKETLRLAQDNYGSISSHPEHYIDAGSLQKVYGAFRDALKGLEDCLVEKTERR